MAHPFDCLSALVWRWRFREALRSVPLLVPRTLLARRLWWPDE